MVSVLIGNGNGNGTFGPKTDGIAGASPHAIVLVDTNTDGVLDIAMANRDSGTASMLRGNGSPGSPCTVTAADMNGDGKPDLMSENWWVGTINLLLNMST